MVQASTKHHINLKPLSGQRYSPGPNIKLVEDAQAPRRHSETGRYRIRLFRTDCFVIAISALVWFLSGESAVFALTIFIAVLCDCLPCALVWPHLRLYGWYRQGAEYDIIKSMKPWRVPIRLIPLFLINRHH